MNVRPKRIGLDDHARARQRNSARISGSPSPRSRYCWVLKAGRPNSRVNVSISSSSGTPSRCCRRGARDYLGNDREHRLARLWSICSRRAPHIKVSSVLARSSRLDATAVEALSEIDDRACNRGAADPVDLVTSRWRRVVNGGSVPAPGSTVLARCEPRSGPRPRASGPTGSRRTDVRSRRPFRTPAPPP